MRVRIGYLTSQYPAASHTFIRREIAALRGIGWTIDTFSVRSPAADEVVDRNRAEVDQTYYILKQGLGSFLKAHFAGLFTRPTAYLKTFGVALTHRAPGVRGLTLAVAHFGEAILLARELERREIAHLHNHFANSAAAVGLLATSFLNIRWSFTIHGISETDYPAGLMLGRKIEVATFVVCASWFGRAQGLRLVDPVHWDKVHVVRCGIPLSELPGRTTPGPSPRTIICVGRLSPEKGQSGLLRAFASLLTKHDDLHLRLVGDGPDREPLEKLAADLGISSSVTFCGRLSEPETLREVAGAHIFALPSFMEGLPVVLMEAMALGVPVVASRVAGIPELVDHGRNGFLFAPSNWAELETCLDRLLREISTQKEITDRAQAKVVTDFDIRQSAEALSELFSKDSETGEA